MSSIKVAVRCRPLFEQERPATGLDIQGRRILLDSKTYDPDYTFPPTSSQEDVFAACRPILQCVKDGLNGTLMVYGQTGTGKTYTMLGADGADNGLVHKVIAHMLDHVQQKTLDGAQCALTLSMIEIYNERLTDMLSENGDQEVTLVAGFPRSTSKVTLGRLTDANEAVKKGLAVRHTAATLMNERSSRSHVVFIVDLEEYNPFTEETEVAHLFMVDLAGSESIKKSQASGTTAGEAGKINKSLLALKSVFLALSNTNEATRPAHVPYRDSRLTELLQDSIGGTARTLMIACISSVGRDIEETKSTLLYAVKARSIRNAANTEKEKLLIRLRSMEAENQRLRNRLQERVNERGGYYITKEEHDRYEVMEAESKELRECVEQLVKDSQASDARKHISESQSKILQGLVDDKEEELQRFKNMYHEALQRFERNASALQRVVQGSVDDVQRTLRGSAAQRHERLARWKSQMLSLLAAPPPDAPVTVVVPMAPLAASPPGGGDTDGDNEEATLPSLQIAAVVPAPSPQKAMRPNSARGSLANQHGTNSRAASPGKKGGGVGGPRRLLQRDRSKENYANRPSSAISLARALEEEESEASPVASPSMLPMTSSGGRGTPAAAARSSSDSPCPMAFLQEADNACHAIVQRVNGAFVDLLQELTTAYTKCDEATRQVAAAQARQTDAICEQLRSGVEECIHKLQKAGTKAVEDTDGAKEELRSRLRVLGRMYLPDEATAGSSPSSSSCPLPGPCEVRPLQDMVREACAATVRSGEASFPMPEVPGEVSSSLDRVLLVYQSKLSSLYTTALAPLATVSAQPQAHQQAFQSLLASSAQQQQTSQAMAAAMSAEGSEPILPCFMAPSPTSTGEMFTGSAACSIPPLAPTTTAAATAGALPLPIPHDANSTGYSRLGGCPGSPLSSGAPTTAAGSPAGPPPSRAHSRTTSYSGPSSTTAPPAAPRENRFTTGSRFSHNGNNPTASSSSNANTHSARSSLRAQRPSAMNRSPRPLHKRTRSAAGSAPSGRGSVAPESGRRTPSSRTEQRK